MIFFFFFPDSDDEDTVVDVAGDDDSEELLDGMAPTSKRNKKIARREALNKCLGTGEYPEFIGVTGVVDEVDPSSTECLDFVKLLWPDFLCEHIAVQTNLYPVRQAKQC